MHSALFFQHMTQYEHNPNYYRNRTKEIRIFYDSIKDNELSTYSIEINLVTFGGTKTKYMAIFASLQLQSLVLFFKRIDTYGLSSKYNIA